MIEREDFEFLQKEFDNRYVLQSSCNEKQEQVRNKLANDDKRIDLILANQKNDRENFNSKIAFNNWLTTAVLAAIIGAVIAFYCMKG